MTKEQSHVEAVERARALQQSLDGFEKLVESFLDSTDIGQTRFSYMAGGHVDFLRHLRGGRDHRISTVRRAVAYMAGYDGAAAPVDPLEA